MWQRLQKSKCWLLEIFFAITVVALGPSKRLLKPPPWDKYSKDFSLWFREIKEWEIATKIVAALKNFQDIKLALN